MAAPEQIINFGHRGGDQILLLDEFTTGTIFEEHVRWVPQKTVDGIASRTLEKTLGRNALVRRFDVVIRAVRAEATSLANSGQVRLQLESGTTKIVVVDFGVLRTVSGIGVTGIPTIKVCTVYPWLGADFAEEHIYYEDCEAVDIDSLAVVTAEENLFEVRTERLKIKLQTSVDLDAIADNVFLEFPDLPADLDLRINNGPPVWLAPGAAQPDARGWSSDATQQVELAAALESLTGDPTDESALPLQMVLTSRIPASLELSEATSVTDISWLSRITFDGQAERILDFEAEGVIDLVLPLPSWVNTVEEVHFTLKATVPAERTLPPVGPDVALLGPGDGSAVDLLLDVDHAAAARLPADTNLVELTGIRLPLAAGEDGAEVRVVLYDGTVHSPTAAVEAASSTPVVLEAGDANAEGEWLTFTFPQPVAMPEDTVRWAVVVVSRGVVAWSLGDFPDEADVVPIRRGVPNGPWHSLPSLLPAGNLGARIRQTGTADKETPVAPLLIEGVGTVSGGEIAALPTTKGARIVWTPLALPPSGPRPRLTPNASGGSKSMTLRITSRMIGRVTLSEVDVVATK